MKSLPPAETNAEFGGGAAPLTVKPAKALCQGPVGASAGQSKTQNRVGAESFTHHVLERRLERTAALLRDPQWHHCKIAAVAAEAGFADLSYFNHTFRRTSAPHRRMSAKPPMPALPNAADCSFDCSWSEIAISLESIVCRT
jgi:hypothetical protein